jgi:hypothetical protein
LGEAIHRSKLVVVTETPDDLLAPDAPETEPSSGDVGQEPDRDDDDPGLSAEESLGLLPPD